MAFVKLESFSMKNNPLINEDMIQKYIAENPSVLGLGGNLETVARERILPSKGRVDIVLKDDESATRYEVEVQLGPTDPSHIIRTIEYWDIERMRYPQYEHRAVIIAEEITGRFMNVISLIGKSIPIIALQVKAYKMGDDISLVFTKILDYVPVASDEDENYEPTDRAYWETKSNPKMLKNMDEIFKELKPLVEGYELKYNKFYIGLAKDGLAKNFIRFQPTKSSIHFEVKGEANNEKVKVLDDMGFPVKYDSRWKWYRITLKSFDQFNKNKAAFIDIVKTAMDYYKLEYDIE